jgi:hypothetical protein
LAAFGSAEVFPPNPFGWFVAVSSFGPTPKHVKDFVVYPNKGLFAGYVPVIIYLSFNPRIEFVNQLSGGRLLIPIDSCPYFTQECFDTFLTGLDE